MGWGRGVWVYRVWSIMGWSRGVVALLGSGVLWDGVVVCGSIRAWIIMGWCRGVVGPLGPGVLWDGVRGVWWV